MKKILILFFLLFLLGTVTSSFIPVKTQAATSHVVVNELLPHPTSGNPAWVELYNPLDTPVDINNWVVRNDNASNNLIGRFNIVLSSKSFVATEAADRMLANEGDTIKLFDNSDNEIDLISYDTDPGINKSIGRSQDGGDNLVVFSSPTEGYSNNLLPTSTATPEITPTIEPTQVPTATPEPTEISTPTPTLFVTPSETPTPSPEETSEPSPTSSPQPSLTPSPLPSIRPFPGPIDVFKTLEERMTCRFSYERFSRMPNHESLITLIKSIFGPNSVCHLDN